MQQEKTYKTLKRLLESGNIEDFEEIVEIIGKTYTANLIGIHYDTFRKRLKHPEDLEIAHILKIATLIDVEPEIILQLIVNKYRKKKKK